MIEIPLSRKPFDPIFWVALLILLVSTITASLVLLRDLPLSIDEGVHINWASLLVAGYAPYSEVYMGVPPLWPLLLAAVWYVWPSLTGLNMVMLFVWAVGIAVTALIGQEITGDTKAALAAGMLLALSILYFETSQAVLSIVPTSVAALIAIWLALLHERTGRRDVLIGSAIFTAISLMLKLLYPFLPLLVLGIILYRQKIIEHRQTKSELIYIILIWGGSSLILPVLSILLADPAVMIEQIIGQRLGARTAYAVENDYWDPRWERFLVYLRYHLGLVWLGAVGLSVGLYTKKQGPWFLVAWLGAAIAMLAFQIPIRSKYFILLSPPLALATSYLFSITHFPHRFIRWSVMSAILSGLLIFIANFAWQVPQWQALAQKSDPPLNQIPVIELISEITSPDDCLVTDYAQLYFWTSRLPPPKLAELTSNRLKSGFITTPELVESTEMHDCPVVAPLTGRLARSTPDYLEWVKSNYYGRFVYDDHSKVLYFGKSVDGQAVAQEGITHNILFGQDQRGDMELELVASVPLPAEIKLGDDLFVTLFWKVVRSPDTNYTIFVQLRNAENVPVAGADHQPYKGLLPFSKWPVGSIMPETSRLNVPSDLLPGEYSLYVGLYDQSTLERLPIYQDLSEENAVRINTTTVRN